MFYLPSRLTKLAIAPMQTAVCCLLLLLSSQSFAQIEEVTVQAEIPQDEALTDLASVNALDAEKLADAGIENVEDVAAYVPNLVLTQTETGTSIVIRGIGAGANQGFDQSVGLYIDGVPLPRANMARAPFLDLSSVQVLRGPQYVLDGNFSIAGSVHMLSNLSVDEFKSGIDFNYTPSQNGQSLLLTAGGPFSDWFAARVAVQAKRSDGYIENVTRDESNESDDLIGRLVLGLNPTDNLSIKLKIEKGRFETVGRAVEIFVDEPVPDLSNIRAIIDFDQDGDIDAIDQARGDNFTLRQPNLGGTISAPWVTEADYIQTALRTQYRAVDVFGPILSSGNARYAYTGRSYLEKLAEIYTNPQLDITNAAAVAPTPAPIPVGLLDDQLNFKRGADAPEASRNDSENFTLNLDYWLGEHKLVSNSSYITYEFGETVDADFTAAPLITAKQFEKYEQLYQSFNYASPEGYFLEFKMGGSYLHSNLLFKDRTTIVLSERASHTPISGGFDIADLSFYPEEPIRQYLGAANLGRALLPFESWGPDRIFTQKSDITAAFFQATFNWRDNLRTNFGMRYTHSIKDSVRDLAIIANDGSIPEILTTGPRLISQQALNSMFTRYLSLFGVQQHSDRVPFIRTDGVDTRGGPALRGRRREETLLPSITLEWDVNDDLSAFFSARMAGKLGGFDARASSRPDVPSSTGAPAGTFEFDNEQATTFELGTKWYLPWGLGEMTTVAFYTDYIDLQVSRFDGKAGFNVDNAGAANSKGVEIEGLLQLTDRFSMQYSLAWIDFTFKDFIFGTCHLGERADYTILTTQPTIAVLGVDGNVLLAGDVIPLLYEEVNRRPTNEDGTGLIFQGWIGKIEGSEPIGPYDTTALRTPAFCDFEGKTAQFVADWQSTVTFNYETEIKELGLFKPTLDIIYNSGYFASASQDPLAAQDEFVQFNGRLALVSFEDTWTVAITGQNLTNEKIISYANDTPIGSRFQGARGFAGFVRPPRTIGVNVRYNFY